MSEVTCSCSPVVELLWAQGAQEMEMRSGETGCFADVRRHCCWKILFSPQKLLPVVCRSFSFPQHMETSCALALRLGDRRGTPAETEGETFAARPQLAAARRRARGRRLVQPVGAGLRRETKGRKSGDESCCRPPPRVLSPFAAGGQGRSGPRGARVRSPCPGVRRAWRGHSVGF